MTNKPSVEQYVDAVLRTDLVCFIRKVFETLNPGTLFTENWHHQAIAYQLEPILRGEKTQLVINVPPRTLKSTIISVAYVAYLLGHAPHMRIIVASYNDTLAKILSRDFRKVVASKWYRRLFPATVKNVIKNTENEFVTQKNGGRFATSVDGPMTGIGANLVIIDDPMKASDANSETARQNTISWLRETAFSRFDDPKTGSIILVMQRLHQDDLSGFMLGLEEVKHLKMPAIAPDNEAPFALSATKTYQRQSGEFLEQRRIGAAEMERDKNRLGAIIFQTQYQQEPLPPEGNIYKIGYFDTRYNKVPEDFDEIIISWDTAAKIGERNDYSAGCVFGIKGNKLYLLEMIRGRYEYPELLRIVCGAMEQYGAKTVLIEDSSTGTALIQELERKSRYNVIPIKPKTDKLTRAQVTIAPFQAKRIILPEDAEWLPELIAELLSFPTGRYDDQVDCIIQFLEWEADRDSPVEFHAFLALKEGGFIQF